MYQHVRGTAERQYVGMEQAKNQIVEGLIRLEIRILFLVLKTHSILCVMGNHWSILNRGVISDLHFKRSFWLLYNEYIDNNEALLWKLWKNS